MVRVSTSFLKACGNPNYGSPQFIIFIRFIDEVTKIIPIVRSLCPEHMLAHEFQMCTHNQVLNPLREMQSLFGTPHKLIQKWRDKYSDSIRLYQSNPEIAMQAKQIFSALNAQLMAELPKVSTESRPSLYLGLVRLKFDVRVKVQKL